MKKTILITSISALLGCGSAVAAENEAYVLANKPPVDGVIRQQDMIYAYDHKMHKGKVLDF